MTTTTRRRTSPAPSRQATGPVAVAPVRLGSVELATPVVLAPMAGVTNAAFRRLCRSFGGGLFVSEMVAARGLLEGHDRTAVKASFADDEPVRSLQLYAVDPGSAGEATAHVVHDLGVDHVDLNFGCPVARVTRHGGGAALPWRTELFRAIVARAVANAAGRPVTVKLRKGIDDDHLTYLDAGRIAVEEGAAAVTLHGRTARDAYSGTADWEAIRRLVAACPEVPVFGNGDVWRAQDAVDMLRATGAAGVAIGRGCLGRPWLFRDLEAALAGRPVPPPPDLDAVVAMLRRHADLLVEHLGAERGVRELRKHTSWYLQGFAVGGRIRGALHRVETRAEVDDLLDQLPRPQAFPEGGMDLQRGHRHGPQRVKLPEGWLAARTIPPHLDDRAAVAVSGG